MQTVNIQLCQLTKFFQFFLHYVDFIDHLTGYLVGSNGSVLKTIDGGVGIEEQKPPIIVTVFPDPASDHITLEIPGFLKTGMQNGECSVYNMMGRLMLKLTLDNHKTDINTNSLPSGIYMIHVNYNGTSGTGKFIRE